MIGRVSSPLTDMESAPKQGDEGAPDAWLEFEPALLAALDGIVPGDHVLVLTWLDRADRDVLVVHPRGDSSRPEQGVFSTRSPTARTRSGSTGWRCSRSTGRGWVCGTSRPSTA
ncbi:MAG TPA: TrmO family methyltransferase, partial [Solirubrobacterales bacterium]